MNLDLKQTQYLTHKPRVNPNYCSPRFCRGSLVNRFEVEIERNQMLSRVAVEILGQAAWRVAFSRNKYEAFEAFMDSFSWLAFGLALPTLILLPITKRLNVNLAKAFKTGNKALLNIPLQMLDKTFLSKAANRQQFMKLAGLQSSKNVGVLAEKLQKYKMGILFVDLAFFSLKNQLYFWGRNAFTEWWSHKKGFSGEFNLTNQQQREQNAAKFDTSAAKRKRISNTLGMITPFVLPALLLTAMRTKSATGIGGILKKALPLFNYHHAIYMSKWILLYNSLFNKQLTGVLASRDKHEVRETLIRAAVIDFFYYFGDDIFAGLAAKYFQNKYQKQLKNIKLYRTGILNLPIRKKMDLMLEEVAKQNNPRLTKLVNQLGRIQFRVGLLSTALMLGIGLTLANNWFTRQKLLREQQNNSLS